MNEGTVGVSVLVGPMDDTYTSTGRTLLPGHFTISLGKGILGHRTSLTSLEKEVGERLPGGEGSPPGDSSWVLVKRGSSDCTLDGPFKCVGTG